jgi:S1-C subfamily serine protease
MGLFPRDRQAAERNRMMNPLVQRRSSALVLITLAAALGGTSPAAHAQESAKSPIVVAVENVRPSVVAIRLPKANGKKDTVGTGVIIHAEGIIVTNRHVVGSYKTVYARLHDGREYVAQVLMADPNADLALLRIQSPETKFDAMPLDPVDHLWVGEEVIAIGHPYGYTFTVSRGIVSALGREITMPTGEVLGGLIQTDASINPGNSGGPLLNAEGQLIGINVALRDGAQGIAFAINVDNVRGFVTKHLGVQWLTHKQSKTPTASVATKAGQVPGAKASAKPAPAVQAGAVKDAPKAKAPKADEPAPAADPAANDGTSVAPKTTTETSSIPPVPVTPAAHGAGSPPAAPTHFDGTAPATNSASTPLLLVLIGLLLVVIAQQYLLMRRGATRPAYISGP